MACEQFENFARGIHNQELKKTEAVHARELIDAMESATTAPDYAHGTINDFIKRRIGDHQRMIRTLEWFGSHLGLDNPEEDLLVQRVIYEGLNALIKQKRDGKL